jgi:hypothetical protein
MEVAAEALRVEVVAATAVMVELQVAMVPLEAQVVMGAQEAEEVVMGAQEAEGVVNKECISQIGIFILCNIFIGDGVHFLLKGRHSSFPTSLADSIDVDSMLGALCASGEL